MHSAVVSNGALPNRDQPQPQNPLVFTLGSNWRGAQARWLNTNRQADASGQAPILSMLVLHSHVSPGVHPLRDLPACHQPLLDRMVSTGGPHWCGAQAWWLYKCGCRLLLMITPSDGSPVVSIRSKTNLLSLVTNFFSTRWSPPVLLIDVVLMISGSLSASTQSVLR